MKAMAILLLMFATMKNSAFGQCLTNAEFAQYCGTEIYKNNDPTFADDCVPGWKPSHGTPQIKWINFTPSAGWTQATKPVWNAAYMWAEHDEDVPTRCRGEGILANFAFKKDYTYKVQLHYKVDLSNPQWGSNGEIRLIAANNIHRPSTWKYGNLIPWTDGEQRIATLLDHVITPWKLSDVMTYTADHDYNEFWIYPYTVDGDQYNLYVDWISLCRDDCGGNYYYKQGVIPSGDPKFGYIYIGSSYGGSGTVTVSSTAQTTTQAANEINVKQDFSAVVTSGSYLLMIEPCSGTLLYTRSTDAEQDTASGGAVSDYSIYHTNDVYCDEYSPCPVQKKVLQNSETESTGSQFAIYPNPTSNIFYVDFYSHETSTIRILNSLGMIIRQKIISSQEPRLEHIPFDITNLPNGTYFLQLIDHRGSPAVKRIEKMF
jgi:hypothetical protein